MTASRQAQNRKQENPHGQEYGDIYLCIIDSFCAEEAEIQRRNHAFLSQPSVWRQSWTYETLLLSTLTSVMLSSLMWNFNISLDTCRDSSALCHQQDCLLCGSVPQQLIMRSVFFGQMISTGGLQPWRAPTQSSSRTRRGTCWMQSGPSAQPPWKATQLATLSQISFKYHRCNTDQISIHSSESRKRREEQRQCSICYVLVGLEQRCHSVLK